VQGYVGRPRFETSTIPDANEGKTIPFRVHQVVETGPPPVCGKSVLPGNSLIHPATCTDSGHSLDSRSKSLIIVQIRANVDQYAKSATSHRLPTMYILCTWRFRRDGCHSGPIAALRVGKIDRN